MTVRLSRAAYQQIREAAWDARVSMNAGCAQKLQQAAEEALVRADIVTIQGDVE